MSNAAKIPLMYHPTNVLLLDDERGFLNSLNPIIGHTTPYILETNPHKVIDYLQSHTYKKEVLSALISEQDFSFEMSEKPRSTETFDINFSRLQQQLDKPDRFKKIVTVFVDKHMPAMDGITFCEKVREMGLIVKLILFTGMAGTDEAVRAFNKGIIDGYIAKDDPNLTDKINQYIERYSWQQFIDLGDRLAGFISHLMKPLHDEQFFEVFEKIREVEKFNSVEDLVGAIQGDVKMAREFFG